MHLQRCVSKVGMIFEMAFLQYHRGTGYSAGKYEMSSLSSGTAIGSGWAICAQTEDARGEETLRDRVMEGVCVV